MKAMIQGTYGGPEILQLQDVERPQVGDGDVLVRVHAASIHVGDRLIMTGRPFLMSMATGIRRPKEPIPGTDIAGTVTGVTSTRNAAMVRSIGADHVIDYTREDFTKGTERYDFILDNVANHSLRDTRRALSPTGMLQPNGGGHTGGGTGRLIRATIASMFIRGQGRPSVKFHNPADLAALVELVEAGKVTPVIDRAYPLAETAAAIRPVGTGRARGTVVITIAAPAPRATTQACTAGAAAPLTAGGVA